MSNGCRNGTTALPSFIVKTVPCGIQDPLLKWAILGWGCIPWAGGPFGWLDLKGALGVLEICKNLSDLFGERFQAPTIIKTLAKNNSNFYDLLNN